MLWRKKALVKTIDGGSTLERDGLALPPRGLRVYDRTWQPAVTSYNIVIRIFPFCSITRFVIYCATTLMSA